MRTYYRGPDAVVTSEFFAGRAVPARQYAIRDLRNVRIAHSEPAGSRPTARHALLGMLVIAVASVPLWKASPLAALGLLMLGAPAVAAGALFWRLRPQQWALRATYRGHEVTLYASQDERVFHQVARALRRAIEEARPLAPWGDLAAA
jgi:hypothetical protein